MKSALSSKVAEKEIIVLDELKFDAPKDKRNDKSSGKHQSRKESPDRHGWRKMRTS